MYNFYLQLWSLLDGQRLEESLDVAFKSKTAERANDLKNLISRLKTEITGYACL